MEFCKTFTKILQFNSDLPLNTQVVSDHAEIIAQTPYGDIAAWNISNPLHHHYFGMSEAYTFSKTHMFIDREWISSKINLQINSIVSDMISGLFVAFVVVEGYLNFYKTLEEILNTEEFGIFYDKDPPSVSDEDKSSVNITGIIVNLKVFGVRGFTLYSEIYEEESDIIKPGETRKKRLFNVPVVYLENGGGVLALGGVHVHGSNSRNPKTGLNLLRNILIDIKSKSTSYSQIIFMGDFNTIPKNVGDVLGKEGRSPFRIKLTDYPTMVNPRTEVSFYDMTVVYPESLVTMKSLDHTNIFTQELLESVCRSREAYLLSLNT